MSKMTATTPKMRERRQDRTRSADAKRQTIERRARRNAKRAGTSTPLATF